VLDGRQGHRRSVFGLYTALVSHMRFLARGMMHFTTEPPEWAD
jgi:hypothetical protein